jgi:hypothetical protein
MVNDEQYADTLQWAIDRQKSDHTDIRKQLRRHFILIITLVTVRIAVFLRGDEILLDPLRSESLAQDGILWQTNILPAKMAPVFTDTITFIAGIFSVFGLLLLGFSMFAIVQLEGMQNCHPIGDTNKIIGRDIGQLERWVEENDELIRAADQGRRNIIRIGTDGVILIVASFVTQILAGSLAIGAILILAYVYVKFWDTFKEDELVSGTRLERVASSFILFITITQPFSAYQEVYGLLPIKYRILLVVVSVIAAAYPIRSDIIAIKNIVLSRLLAMNIWFR